MAFLLFLAFGNKGSDMVFILAIVADLFGSLFGNLLADLLRNINAVLDWNLNRNLYEKKKMLLIINLKGFKSSSSGTKIQSINCIFF